MGRPLSEAARDKAQAAALEVIARAGVAGFTVDAVAKLSGVAKTTIYRHWDSANALLIDTIDCMVVPFPTPDTGSLGSDLQAFLDVLGPVFDDPTMVRTMLGTMAAASFDEELNRIHQELMTERKRPIREMIDRALARGEIRDDLPMDTIVDMIEGPFMSRFILRRVGRDRDEERLMVDLIVRALRRNEAD
ncbi:MAG: TetR/AcrR family transcriptional regulator [Acidimicrobiales bacterium]